MKVLFVSSGNSKSFSIAPFIKAQGEDLKSEGVDVDFYPIKGRGLKGYLKNIPLLRKQIKENNYDLIHAHFVLSAWIALLSGTGKKMVVSFMGSDTYGDVDINGKRTLLSYREIILAKLIQPFIDAIIVKSPNLERYIYLKKKCTILPNGVNLKNFELLDYNKTREELGLALNKKYILFLGNTDDPRKNFNLVRESINYLKDDIELLTPYPIPHNVIVKYLNAADLLAFSSYLEGSPNLIKEAMACDLPIVSVDVGDVVINLTKVKNCLIADYHAKDFADKINEVLKSFGRSNGRESIVEKGLESNVIAKRLINIYESLLGNVKNN